MKLILYCTFFVIFIQNLIAQTDSIPIISEKTCQTEVFCLDTVNCGVLPILLTCDAKSRSKNLPILKYSYTIDWDCDGKIDLSGSSQNIKLDESKGLKPGKHKINWVVKDFNNLENCCEKSFEVKDCVKPVIYALEYRTFYALPYTCERKFTSKDLIDSIFENCSPNEKIITKIVKGTFSTISIDSFKNLSDTITMRNDESYSPLTIFAIDQYQNFSIKNVHLYFYDIYSSDCFYGTSILESYVKNDELIGIENVAILINGYIKSYTGADGFYSFLLAANKNYTISCKNDGSHRNGVTTADLVAINKYLLKIEDLSTPYRHIAADVNNDKNVSIADIIELRKLILFINDTFPNSKSWVFIPKEFKFSSLPESDNYPTSVDFYFDKKYFIEFIGVKIGDVNGTAKANKISDATERSIKNRTFELQDIEIQENGNQEIRLPITDLFEQDGFQIALKINPNFINELSIEGLDPESYHFNKSTGELFVSYVNGLSIGNELVINIIAKKTCWLHEIVQFSNDKLSNEYYADNQSHKFDFIFSNQKFNVGSPQPNPFHYNTQMTIFTPEPEILKIEIIRSDGALMHQRNMYCQKGENILQLSQTDMKEGGVYQCVIKSKQGISVQKIIFIK